METIERADIAEMKAYALAINEKADAFSENEVIAGARRAFGYSYAPAEKKYVRLLSVLERLQIDVLDSKAVEAYQAKKVAEMSKQPRAMWPVFIVAFCCLSAIAAAIANRCGGLVMHGGASDPFFVGPIEWVPTILFGCISVVALPAFIAMAITAVIEELGWPGKEVKASWVEFPLRDYAQYVPDHVLSKALEIRAACPRATFNVVELRLNHVVRDPDPFLTVRLNTETYYVEVWDERDFEIS